MKVELGQTIYWSLLHEEDWHLYLAATTRGLCYVGSQGAPFDEVKDWVGRRFPGSSLVEAHERLEPYRSEMMEYLRGQRKRFSVPFDVHGTPFQHAVWNALCEIPFGETQSYSEIAYRIQKPNAVRAVGAAIGANPVLISIPCHRVVGKNGSLTGYRGGLDMKKKLLQLENVDLSQGRTV